jgi:anti-anti-sigma regulatory factor
VAQETRKVAAIVAGPRLDWTAYRALRPAVTHAIGDGTRTAIRIDLSAVTAMEPAGIGALVVLHELAARSHKAVVLEGVGPRFDALLRDCGLDIGATAPATSPTHVPDSR